MVPVVAGGAVDIEKTDGYLVASIINPSHQIARRSRELLMVGFESRMPSGCERGDVHCATAGVEQRILLS